MKKINSYLTFNGNCREAMTFYRECLGGELVLQTIGESPMSDRMPEEMRSSIMHAMLTADNFVLMGSDMVAEKGLMKGNNVSMMVDCSSEKDVRELMEKLSSGGGEILHPLEDTFWGALFGDLADRFGNTWLLHFDKNQNQKLSIDETKNN